MINESHDYQVAIYIYVLPSVGKECLYGNGCRFLDAWGSPLLRELRGYGTGHTDHTGCTEPRDICTHSGDSA